MQIPALLSVSTLLASMLGLARGHGYISDPAANWQAGYPQNGYGSTIDNEIWGVYDNAVYGYGVEGTVAFFKAEFPDSGYETLQDFILANQELVDSTVDTSCGYTVYDDTKRSALPASAFEYSGFTHAGPCEFWCDDNKVAFDLDCQATYPDIPASVPFDSAQCANANKLTVYWIGLHGDPWQVYVDCVWLEGGSGSGGASTTPSSNSTTPAATTAAPTATTAAPTATTAAPTTTTAAPTTTTAAPAATTEAPAGEADTEETTAPEATTPAATEKCTASARRHRRRD